MEILINNVPGLIGDFLGALPAIQELSKYNKIYISSAGRIDHLVKLIPNSYDISYRTIHSPVQIVLSINLDKCFSEATKNNWYMTQSFMHHFGIPVKGGVFPKADIVSNDTNSFEPSEYYLLSPFARSLPESQKLDKDMWQKFVDLNPNKLFMVLGDSKYDPPEYIKGYNVADCYDKPLTEVCKIMQKSRGLISLVTGTSHLAFHLGVRNLLITNQGTSGWGINPDSTKITTSIKRLKPEELQEWIGR